MLVERLRPLHAFLVNKWYFDELIDVLVVRPALAIGRFANRTFERVVVQRASSPARSRCVRDASGVVRTVQSGFVRSYALLLVGGFAAPRPLLPACVGLDDQLGPLDTAALRRPRPASLPRRWAGWVGDRWAPR